MRARWLIVLVTATMLVVTPLAIGARPAVASNLTAVELAGRIQNSRDVSWSGMVASDGALQIPDSDSFASLAQLLGENNQLRVWWRNPDEWRIDRIRSTGETDLFRQGNTSVRWVFESETASIAPTSNIRLPDASDLLPSTLGRAALLGFHDNELTRLPARRVAGVPAAGLRLTPDDDVSTIDHVDLWADPKTGLPVRVELYGSGDRRPVLTTAMLELTIGAPDPLVTRFVPGDGVTVNYDESVDVAASANALARFDLPTTLADLPTRSGGDPGAVAVYGRGPTALLVMPLRGQVAGPLRERLRSSAGASETAVGTLAPVGPVVLLITAGRGRGGFLLAGTVTSETLQRAAADLLGRR